MTRKIWSVLTPTEQRSAIILLGLMFIGTLLETLGIGLVIPAIALLTQRDFASNYPVFQPALQAMGNPSRQALIIGGMVVLLGIYLIKALYLTFYTWRQTRFAFDATAMLSQRLFTIYLCQPYTFHLQRNSAQLIANAITEVTMFIQHGMIPGMLLLTESLVVLGLCSLLLVVEPLGVLIVVVVLGTTSWGFYCFARAYITRWGEARQHHDGLRMQHLQQGLGGVKDVRLLGREKDFLAQYHVHNTESARVAGHMQTLQQLPRLWLEVLAVSGFAILAISMLAQDQALESVLPTLGLFAASAFRLMPSINRVMGAVQSLRYGLPVINVLHKELNLAIPAIVDTRSPATPFSKTLELSLVTYTYPGAAEPALKDISLVIQRGESVGFVGASGAGKSTLVDILLGLLTPDTGEIRADGKDIQLQLRNWQDQIGYVPQTIFLTDDTLRRNVAFGLANEQIDDVAVQRAVRAAQLEEFVVSQPDGLETFVGERGVRLSGGQRQRIGIARALYHDPAVLVLDEATSALDTATESDVIQAVTALHGTKTIIIVAHRLSTVEHCDRLYRLHEGRLMEDGTSNAMVSHIPKLKVTPAQAGNPEEYT